MKAQNPSTSLGEGRDVAPSLAHPSQKQNLGVYTEELTHLTKSANLRYRLLNEAAQRQKNREESKKDKLGHHA
jgi:hypothetical protein